MASTSPSTGAAGPGVGGHSPEPDLTVSVVGDPRLHGEIVGGEARLLAAEQSPPRPGAGIPLPRAPCAATTKKSKKLRKPQEEAGMASSAASAGAAGPGVGGSSPEGRPLAAEQSPPRPGAGIPRATSTAGTKKSKKFKKTRDVGTESAAASGWCGVGGGNSLDETMVGDTRLLRREDLGREREVRTLAPEQRQPRPAAGIRRAQPTAARASKKPKKAGMVPDRISPDSTADDVPSLVDVIYHPNALAPMRIHDGPLWKSDRLVYQNRLQIPCKRLRSKNKPIPLEQLLTEEEKPRVKAQAYDRTGQPYLLSINYVESNDSYRLVGGWGKFLKLHNLIVDQKNDTMEPIKIRVFAFRSPALKVGVPDEQGSRLGLLLVHYHQDEDPAKHAFAVVNEILAKDDADDDSGEPE